jgi:hypothetical protein|uniref:thiol oxidase n=1 Tax=viral metagenome TaxID=1070528 RepID=A0A6C0JD08_9ZZZZ
MKFEPATWGPHYWFTLMTIALTYPEHPNNTTKKKYYDFIQNLPLFLPDADISNTFASLLNKYPVSPYLDSRESFVRWIHFIHNQVNSILNKPQLSMQRALQDYYLEYSQCNLQPTFWTYDKVIFLVICCFITLLIAVIYLHNHIKTD